MSPRTARDVMTDDVTVIDAATSVRDAAKTMRDLDVGCLPVAEFGELMGMLTDRDIVLRVVAEGRDPASVTAGETATRGVHGVDADAPAAEALTVMGAQQVGRLAVTTGGRIVGIISRQDIAARLPAEDVGETTKEVTGD